MIKLVCIKNALPYCGQGETLTPYAESDTAYIVHGPAGMNMDHHIRKDGQYLKEHFEIQQ